MMAEIEEKLGGDTGLVRAWMARALRAPRDPAWVADGIVSAEWEPLSPVTGRLDAFEWRVPLDKVSGDGTQIGRPTGPTAHLAPPPLEDETFDEEIGDDGPEEEADDTPLLPPARTVDGVETIEAAAEGTVGTTAGETMSPPVEEMAPSPEPVATPTAEQPAPQEDVTPPSSEPQDLPAEQQAGAQEAAPPPPGSDAADPEAEPWQPTRAPDDPGPMPDEGDSSQPRRFRLF